MSKPREQRETGEQDLFRARLDQILKMNHELVPLARAIDWPVLEACFGEVFSDSRGMSPLPIRLMAGLAILKHTFNLSDEVECIGKERAHALTSSGSRFSVAITLNRSRGGQFAMHANGLPDNPGACPRA